MSFIGTKSLATVKYTHNTDLHYIVCAVRSLVVKFNCLPNFVLTMVNDIKEGTNHVLKVARKNTLRKTIDGMRREQPATSTTAVYRGAKCVIFATVLWCGRTENTARCKNLNCAPHALPREVRVWKFSPPRRFRYSSFPSHAHFHPRHSNRSTRQHILPGSSERCVAAPSVSSSLPFRGWRSTAAGLDGVVPEMSEEQRLRHLRHRRHVPFWH